ncbi:MAG: Gfo/Idh/MocA family oxidoreductase, partial [Clostridia bacterium]|nr:Gfo/Idh/MocA family oxidoreductase [Clostridia bacterium]
MDTVLNIGVIGLGGRGYGLLHTILEMEGIAVKAVCDKYDDRQQSARKLVEEKAGNIPFSTADFQDVLAMDEVEAVVVSASWADHMHVAIAAMKAGKYAGVEVGG